MHIYRVTKPEIPGAKPVSYHATREEAHTAAKQNPKNYWPDTFIDELAVGTHKEEIVAMLNVGHPTSKDIIKSWTLTERGGLKGCEGPMEGDEA